MKNVNGIDTPFDNAVMSPPTADAQAGGGTKGGVDIPDGKKQDGGGETGQWVTTAKLDDDQAPAASGRPPHMAGS